MVRVYGRNRWRCCRNGRQQVEEESKVQRSIKEGLGCWRLYSFLLPHSYLQFDLFFLGLRPSSTIADSTSAKILNHRESFTHPAFLVLTGIILSVLKSGIIDVTMSKTERKSCQSTIVIIGSEAHGINRFAGTHEL